MLTIGYIRVSTEDQTEFSPDAQRNRCQQHAISNALGPVTFIADEGRSGKDLNRPGMARLIERVEADEVAHVIVWRLDRLSRDSADLSRLIRLLDKHCVSLHSISEGRVDVTSASGRMQAGIQGVLAQYYREGLIENVKLGNQQAIVGRGRWLNRPPTGYDMVNGLLQPNQDAFLVRRIFELRSEGRSYPAIEQLTGVKYSTVRQVCHNRVYLGETRLRDGWYPGVHEALVTPDLFASAQKGNPTGARIGTDLLSGRVVCGLCGKRIAIDSNGRNQGIYRCKHRGRGCDVPGRAARGVHQAARVAMRELARDQQLIDAIRTELDRRYASPRTAQPSRAADTAKLRKQRDKLLQLWYADKISAELFSEQERSLTAKISAVEQAATEQLQLAEQRRHVVAQFDELTEILRRLDIDAMWTAATPSERRRLVTELVDAVAIFADRLEVTIHGAPAITVLLSEVGLRERSGTVGTGPCVSEDRTAHSRTSHWRLR